MSEEPIIDPDAIENLRALGDDDDEESFLKEVIEIFVTDTPIRIQELRTSHANADQTTFIRAAHSIKGSSSNVGARRLCALAQALESDSRNGLEGLDQRISAVEMSFFEAKDALQAL